MKREEEKEVEEQEPAGRRRSQSLCEERERECRSDGQRTASECSQIANSVLQFATKRAFVSAVLPGNTGSHPRGTPVASLRAESEIE